MRWALMTEGPEPDFADVVAQLEPCDLIVVEGNPLEDIDLLGHVENIRLIMQGGKFVKEMF